MGKHQYDVPCVAKTATDTKKKTLRSAQAAKDRVQKLRGEYWEQVKHIQRIAGKWSTLFMSASTETMKAYSTEFREKIVKAYEQGNTSVRKIASRFDVSKSLVQKLLKMKKTQGHVEPRKQGGGMNSELHGYEAQLAEMVEKYPDATLSEYCEYWG
jgi:transposase-like protein